MHRLIAVLMAASALTLVLIGLAHPALRAHGARGPEEAPLATGLDVYMSTTADGPRKTSFLSNTNQLHAVVAYEDAAREQFLIQLEDLSGIVVKSEVTEPLIGDGMRSVPFGIDNFIESYRGKIDEQSTPLQETIEQASQWCGNVPPVPDPWPPVEPTPGGPTPTPAAYMGWSEAMLTVLEQTRSASAELTRTLQAAMTLPDLPVQVPDAYADAAAARQDLTTANARLAGVPQLLRPAPLPTATPRPGPSPTPGGPTPTPPQPDPVEACNRVALAKTEIEGSLAKVDGAVAALPADTTTWRLPPTAARYDDQGNFAGCLQYSTNLFAVVGGRPRDTAADAAQWTVGDPGEPSLMFPSLDQVDPASVGTLGLRLPEGQTAIYAQKVEVPGANHEAEVSAFVTDESCIPVDGTNIAFWTAPDISGGASVSPATGALQDGVAESRLQSGDDVTHNRKGGWVYACAGADCAPAAPTPRPGRVPEGQVWGRFRFDVTGSAWVTTTRLIIRPNEINRLSDDTAGISLQVHDKNGRQVADGTRVRVFVKDGDPGLLAFDRQSRETGKLERRVLGKSADVVVDSGLSRVPPSEDPGYVNTARLYLFAGDEGDGLVTVCYEADEVSSCAANAVTILSERRIYLPVAHQNYDVRAQPTFLPPVARGVPSAQ